MSRRSDWLAKHMRAETDEPRADGLRRRPVEVTDRDGALVPAMLVRCECGGEKFLIYFIRGEHQHMQCTACGASFCDGSCD